MIMMIETERTFDEPGGPGRRGSGRPRGNILLFSLVSCIVLRCDIVIEKQGNRRGR